MARKKVCIVSNSIGFIDFINKDSAIIFKSNNVNDLLSKMLDAVSLTEKNEQKLEMKRSK